MKTVQMTLDEDLIKQVDSIVKENKTTRSAFTRKALTQAIQYHKEQKLEIQQQQGYSKQPVIKDEFGVWEDEQEWGSE